MRRNIEALDNKDTARALLRAGADIAAKFQKYMLVRSIMSVLTGAAIWIVALFAGLELATAWGVIAFVLNYIPFLGPLIATVFPTVFAIVQFNPGTRTPDLYLPQPRAIPDQAAILNLAWQAPAFRFHHF